MEFRVSCCLQVNQKSGRKTDSLDCKIFSLDLNVLCEFTLHAKVKRLAVEGKGNLISIRSIKRKIKDSVKRLSGNDQIEHVDGYSHTWAHRRSRGWKISTTNKI